MSQNSTTVCHIASGDLWAGAEVQVFHLLNGLAQSGKFRPCAVLLNRGKLADRLEQLSIETLVVEEQLHSIWTIRARVRDFIQKQQVSILHSHRYKENIIASSIATAKPLKALVQTVHGIPEPQAGLKKAKMSVYQQLNRAVSRAKFSAIVAVSKEIEAKLAKLYPVEIVHAIHNGIDIPDTCSAEEKSAARKDFGLSNDDFVFTAVGRMVPVKGFDVLLSAVAKLPTDNKIKLLLAGDGPELQLLKELSDSLKLTCVSFLGYQSDIRKVFAAADALVMSSHHEGIPLTLLEAMALELPTVATAVGGIVEVVEHELNALLVSDNDPAALAAAIQRLRSDEALCKRLGAEARTRVSREFSIDKIVNQYEILYGSLVPNT